MSFDIAVHFGTLVALSWYLRQELYTLLLAAGGRGEDAAAGRRLWLLLVVGSLPLAATGLLLRTEIEQTLRHISVIAVANLFFAGWLFRTWQKRTGTVNSPLNLSVRQALSIGLLQAFAVIPGASRSGLVLTGGLAAGLDAKAAVRFSFLLGLPALGGAFVLEWVRWEELARVDWLRALFAAALSGLVALVVLRNLTAWVERLGVVPFVLYRLILGAVLIVFFLQPLF